MLAACNKQEAVTTSEDFIECWVRVDNPTNLEHLQLDFDVSTAGVAGFQSDTTKSFIRVETLLPYDTPAPAVLSHTGLAPPASMSALSAITPPACPSAALIMR